MKISFSPPDITDLEIKEVISALKSGWITTGPKTKELENKLASYIGTEKVVCLNSATAALELILRILGIKEGDEVITCAYTYTASASPVIHIGAKLVLVDTSPNSYQMDYDALENAITDKTKAIIPIDIAGVPCDYDKIFEIVERKKNLFKPSNDLQQKIGRISVVADCAHSLGSIWKNKMAGNIADFSSFSFHAVKNFTTAEGGCATWKNIDGISNEDLYRQFQLLSLHGQSKDALSKTKLGAWEYDIQGCYYKCNMTDISAAIGLAQFNRYPHLLEKRKEIINKYLAGLKNSNINILPHFTNEYSSSGHLFLTRLLNKDETYRNQFIEKMAKAGIATNVHYKPLPMHTAYKSLGFSIEQFPNAYQQYCNEVTLPLHTQLTDEEIDYVIENFKRILSD
ncbi:DegT/DnrJ/EryC1/StrS family aminotransferase [Avibacterium sp. 20-15]|uniref:DegT/DnrJ/EryC1/StrS family aminotransferase n=1 Tax=unclassified Avibacterium TaxID=2685287 RepID=UPI002027420F|nr:MULTISPECIES: DegT/DnrJ/EryC1/StrS family aminotransferase [unclassified Avibacterium]MCW9732196.1 DegT/DnrJ/EryC1/StrS family aminotransferase [Avibacterium sp. 20-15]URL04368.1 DegT/DnrJ/EryC1/StrS family aminotransferase [Avibacterium sp. 20-132]